MNLKALITDHELARSRMLAIGCVEMTHSTSAFDQIEQNTLIPLATPKLETHSCFLLLSRIHLGMFNKINAFLKTVKADGSYKYFFQNAYYQDLCIFGLCEEIV